MQSERLYAAIAGQGGIAKLVKLPHEGHGYRARESIMHTLAEQHDWLTRWVVNKEEKPPKLDKPKASTEHGRSLRLATVVAACVIGLVSYRRLRS